MVGRTGFTDKQQAALYWARKRRRELQDANPPPDPPDPEPPVAVNGLFLGSRSLIRNGTVYDFLDCDLGPPSERRYIALFCYLADVILGLPVVTLNGATMTASATSARLDTGGHQTSLHLLALPDGESANFSVVASDSAAVCGIQWWRLSGFDPVTGVNVLPAVVNNVGGNASIDVTIAEGDLFIACGLAAKTAPSTAPSWSSNVNPQQDIHISGGTHMSVASCRVPPFDPGAITVDMTSLGTGSSILGVHFVP